MRTIIFLAALSVLCGCAPYSITGTVTDTAGQPLPGVAVKVEGGGETVTNAIGEYKVSAHTGSAAMTFLKTGCTRGQARVAVEQAGVTQGPVVALWRLPDGGGLFVMENDVYRRATSCEPVPYMVGAKNLVHAVRPQDVVKTANPMPRLMCFQTPSFDAQLCRLKVVEAAPLDAVGLVKPVWVPESPAAIKLWPVDEPDRRLWEVHLFDPLAPGVYCVHWGAFAGHKDEESDAFLFEVTAPDAAPAG